MYEWKQDSYITSADKRNIPIPHSRGEEFVQFTTPIDDTNPLSCDRYTEGRPYENINTLNSVIFHGKVSQIDRKVW